MATNCHYCGEEFVVVGGVLGCVDCGTFELSGTLEERTSQLRTVCYSRSLNAIEEAAALCQSPIESAIYWALIAGSSLKNMFFSYGDRRPVIEIRHESYDEYFETYSIQIAPQDEVERDDGRAYRLDFGLRTGVWAGGKWTPILVAVECDGHDFHEKTKEQAQHDKRRDREIQRRGWRVLRFTGSEVFKDPQHIAAEIFRFIEAEGVAAHKRAGDPWPGSGEQQ